MAKKKELTPLMKQYWGVKSAHPDKIILFRMGDFFEMFHDDAQTAAPLLGIALTVRNKKSGDQTPMCGVPHHSIGGQINKLLDAGKKVAICDQVEDPKLAKGLVKREITRILSPGMLYDPDTIDGATPHYLCAFDSQVIAFMDSTTGECFYYETSDFSRIKQFIEALNPVEIVISSEQESLFAETSLDWRGLVSLHEKLAEDGAQEEACQRLLSYAVSMQGEAVLKSLTAFEKRQSDFRLQISSQVIRHLEIFKTYKGDKEGTLFSALNRTKTPGGSRRLKNWLLFPLTDLKKITERQDKVSYWFQRFSQLEELRKSLYSVGDLERRLGKMTQPHCHPRDLKSLADSLSAALPLMSHMNDFPKSHEVQSATKEFVTEIQSALVDEIPNNYREGSFISKGYQGDLDEYIEWASLAQKKVRDLEEKERQLTGISSLKVRYNNVFGYYIEVTNTHKNKVPKERYQRKQTLTNAERYVTDELNEIEKKVITAKTKRAELELELFESLKIQVLDSMSLFLQLADQCNQLDVITALAWLAIENNYVKPELKKSQAFKIFGSRHPVIEQFMETQFIANDIVFGRNQCLLLTGPNMAGKSTLMRQVAVTAIMAQMGSFVPAREAQLPLLDKIFTRIGASDFLTEGLSTFMVEMKETAEMLKEATSDSLVVLDEVGRGTSTFDGMSLAQAILEYFITQSQPYTLFATHYHELTQLESRFPKSLLNRHMTISEKKGEILFRYHLAEGPAQKSYGIQVARLAGLPQSVVENASAILQQLEAKPINNQAQLDLWQSIAQEAGTDDSEKSDFDELLNAIRQLEVQNLTPLDALNKLAEWQQELS